jgi:O-antigen/teichoic acid export membrane protein
MCAEVPLWNMTRSEHNVLKNVSERTGLHERARDRERRFVRSAGFSVLSKITAIAVNLLSVPLTYNYLGAERYGVWIALSSLIAILGFADLGVGNGVVNQVAAANGRDDRADIQRACSAGTFVLGAIAGLGLVAFSMAYPLMSWADALNVKGAEAANEVGSALFVLVAIFAVGMPISVVMKVQSGLQQGYRSATWQCLGTLLSLAALLLVVQERLGLPWLVAALAGAPALANGLNWLDFFLVRRRDLMPRLCHLDKASAQSVMRLGLSFLALQLVMAMTSAADGLLIAKALGPEAVAAFAIPDRLFSQVSSVLLLLMAPLWPAYGEALSRGDRQWVARTLRSSLAMAGVFSILAVTVLSLGAPYIFSVWIGKDFSCSIGLLVALSFWKVLESIGGALAAFMNGVGLIRLQVVCALATGILSLSLKILVLPQWGVTAVPWVMALSFLVLFLLPCTILVPRLEMWRKNTQG